MHLAASSKYGCAFCRDYQNRNFGHLNYIAVEPKTGVRLLRCPVCRSLYQDDNHSDPCPVSPSEAEKGWGYQGE